MSSSVDMHAVYKPMLTTDRPAPQSPKRRRFCVAAVGCAAAAFLIVTLVCTSRHASHEESRLAFASGSVNASRSLLNSQPRATPIVASDEPLTRAQSDFLHEVRPPHAPASRGRRTQPRAQAKTDAEAEASASKRARLDDAASTMTTTTPPPRDEQEEDEANDENCPAAASTPPPALKYVRIEPDDGDLLETIEEEHRTQIEDDGLAAVETEASQPTSSDSLAQDYTGV